MDIIQRLYDNQVHHAALLYDGALGHPTGVLHDAPGYLFDIIQVISQFDFC